MNRRNILASVAASIMLGACAASSHVMVGQARSPISPDQVKIYLRPPAKYEEIAIIDASSRGGAPAFTAQQKMDKAMERLKSEAARVGANGILLEGTSDQQAGSIGTAAGSTNFSGHSAYGTGIGLSAGVYTKQAHGLAIYVPQ